MNRRRPKASAGARRGSADHVLSDFVPRYYQVYVVLQQRIRDGEWSADAAMPTEQEFAEKFGVSRVTIRQPVHLLFLQPRDVARGGRSREARNVCDKLGLGANHRVLDIGCGWGGLARYAAETHGCHVTGISISKEQIAYAKTYTAGLPVKIIDADYRDLNRLFDDRSFDRIVIIGMIEHVGHRYYRRLFGIIHRLLKDDGLFLLHTIGNCDTTTVVEPWIEKYIFRNSMAPSARQLAAAAENLFTIHDWENYGQYYAPTLAAWQRNFEANWGTISALDTARRFDNRIGDLSAKLNNLKAANEQYEKVARYYADDGFYLKAIAVWKKVLRNDPSMLEGNVALGDLYARQGLVAEAKQTLNVVVDEYIKRSKKREAGEVLRRLAEVDPSDMKVRIRPAEFYAWEGNPEKAAGEYVAIAEELVKKGHLAEALQLIEKALRSGPRSPRLLSAVPRAHSSKDGL